MDLTEYIKQTGEFLKAEVVKNNPTGMFEICDEAELVENKKFSRTELHLPLKLGEVKYTFNCSKTNARTISAKFGGESKKWIGKFLTLEVYKTKTSEGKLTDAINVKEVK